ncbi:MAG: type II toxin-antitoxin system VapC family toxin [Burkholderiales bacterium]|jgi:predicted nucleic acid-binding protein
MYLLDTNIVSELRKPQPHGGVVAWLQSVNDADLHLSAVTLGEIQAGVELTRDQDASKAGEIEAWLDLAAQSCNVLPMDGATLRRWARLMHRRSDTLYEDAMIAATATVHKLTVVTRNVADFANFDVQVLNPFKTPRA